ncbi:MAG: hypothetical protein Q9192_007664 [Flavoplaca navasiana]
MSTATSGSIVPQRLEISQAKLFFRTAPKNDWTLLDPLYPTPDQNVVRIIIKHGISMRQKFANGAGACTVRMDQEHYTVATLETVPHPSGSLRQSTIRLHLELLPVPACELSRTMAGNKAAHRLEDFPLHCPPRKPPSPPPDFCEIKLDLPRLKVTSKMWFGQSSEWFEDQMIKLACGDASSSLATEPNPVPNAWDLCKGANNDQIIGEQEIIPHSKSNIDIGTMSALVDRILTSDNPDLDLAAGRRSGGIPNRMNGRNRQRSSPRPYGPPSESNGALSDAEGFPDDEVVGVRGTDRNRPRDPMQRQVPRVVDLVGEKVAEEFENFMENFIEDITLSGAPPSSAVTSDKYYIAQIHGLRIYNLSTLYVDFQHLMSLSNDTLANAIANDYYRYLPFLTRALHNLIAKHEPRYFKEHRQPASSSSQTGSSVTGNATSQAESMGGKTTNQQTDKLFTLAFYNLPLISRVRQLRTDSIGKLLSISGTVTRTSEVRPELYLATFICEACRNVIPNVEQTFRYTEPTQCPNATCGNRQGWRLDIRQSTFVDWQKVRIQENSSEIPTGSMPRTMDVILRGEIVDRAKAGEKCVFTGTLIVVPDVSQLGLPGVRPEATRDNRNTPRGAEAGGSGVTGLKALGVRDLTYRMAFLACMVTPDTSTPGQAANQQMNGQANNILASLNQTATIDAHDGGDQAQDAYLQSLTTAEIEDLKQMVHSDHIYSRLVNSLAPMVYGHEIVKKGLLLQLMGGVTKVTPEGMQLRGDINICIVGDPSTSKSQFLK